MRARSTRLAGSVRERAIARNAAKSSSPMANSIARRQPAITFILSCRIKREATSKVRKNESHAYDWFHGIDELGFNFIRDTTPIASIIGTPLVMMVHPSFPAKTVPDFITHAKVNPGKLNYGSAGSGSVSHVVTELLKMTTGINLVHVSYRGGDAQAIKTCSANTCRFTSAPSRHRSSTSGRAICAAWR